MENSEPTRIGSADCLDITGREHLWAQAIAMETGIRVASCYQCLRCTNSCPVSTFMDLKPHQVVRLTLFGESERLLGMFRNLGLSFL